ncbi:MAG: DUF3106 domain-containing protein [bacterium]
MQSGTFFAAVFSAALLAQSQASLAGHEPHRHEHHPYRDAPQFLSAHEEKRHQIEYSTRRGDHPLDYLLLADGDRESINRKKEHYRSLSPGEKAKLRKAREEYEGLSDRDKQRLRERWENMSDEEKARYKKWKNKKKK